MFETENRLPTLIQTNMMWIFGPVIQRLIALEKSFAQYPNIQPGQEFDGYD